MTLKQSSWVSNQGPPAVLPSNSFQIDEVSALSLFWKGVNLVDSAKRVRLLPSAVLLKVGDVLYKLFGRFKIA